jgi:membrane fusion protein, multidrug efflux system
MTFDERQQRVEGAEPRADLWEPGDDGPVKAELVTARKPEGPDRPATAPRPDKGGDGPTETAKQKNEADAKDEGGEQAEKKPALWRRHPLWFLFGGVAVILVALGVFLYWSIAVHPYETTDDAFVDSRQFAVAPKVSGYVVDVPVTDNQFVEAGTVLFRIDRRDYEIAREQAEAQVQSSQAAIGGYDAQIRAQQASIEESKAQVEQAKAALQFAQADAARYQDLAQRGAGTIQRQQQSTSDLQQQQANLSRANAAVNAAQQQIGSIQAQKASAEANLAQARAQLDQANLNLGYTDVTAAQAGRVVRLTAAKGQYAQAGQSLSMFVPNPIWVTANYKETQIDDMRPGQAVTLRIDAYPERAITGTVESVQPGSGTAFSLLPAENATGNYVKVVQRVPVKIVVDSWPQDVSIGPGMSVVPHTHVRPVPAYAGWFGR